MSTARKPLAIVSGVPQTLDGSTNVIDPAAFGTESANTVLAGPTTGLAAAPAFRALAAADVPSSLGNTTVANLTVSGVSVLTGNTTVSNLNVSGNITSSGTLNCTGDSFLGTVVISNVTTASGNISLGTTGIYGGLTIHNATTTHGVGDSALVEAPSNTAITALSGVFVDVGANITLPVAGTYLILANVRFLMQPSTTAEVAFTGKLFNATASADVAKSETMLFDQSSTGRQQGNTPIISVVTVTVATQLNLRVCVTFSSTPTNTNIISLTDGRTTIQYVRIA